MTTPADRFTAAFEELLAQGRQLFEAERLQESLAYFEEARHLAEDSGDERARDRAYVNVAAVRITLDRDISTEMLQRLREVLLAGEDEINSRLAAYNIARAYEFRKDYRKGLFYARIARDRSQALEHADWLASSHNQIGNLLLAESHFEEATAEYREALALLAPEPQRRRQVIRALIEDNLGYAHVILGREVEGMRWIYRSLRALRALKVRREQIFPRLDLAYARLETGHAGYALRHAVHALALAEEFGEDDAVKNALFLVGEAAHQIGDEATARTTFQRLQERYFPGSSHLAEYLLAVNVRKLINLKA